MALYKSPVMGTKKVRLGASTFVAAESSELVGILLENAAILGPDYIVDRQEVSPTARSPETRFQAGNPGTRLHRRHAGGEPYRAFT